MNIKKSFDEVNAYVVSFGYELLSKEYLSAHRKLKFKCDKGHIYEASWHNFRSGKRCPVCAGKRQSINDLKDFANTKGGKCLSDQYLGANSKHHWECEFGHQWSSKWSHIKRGSWCPTCAGRLKLEESSLIEHASQKSGKCLNPEYYKNNKTKLKWECEKGHTWIAGWEHILRGHWCPTCSGRRQTIKDLQHYAHKLGGKCLSNVYLGTKSKYLWECDKKHQWRASWEQIKQNHWCPSCVSQTSKAEQSIGDWLNTLGITVSKKIRPKWLRWVSRCINRKKKKTKSKKRILKPKELDLYVESKKLAIEYCGLHWHSEKQKERDYHEQKFRVCRNNSVQLLTVFEHDWRFRQNIVKSFIKSKLGIYSQILNARSCKVMSISVAEANVFLRENHLQGSSIKTKFAIALTHKGEIVAVVTGGWHHRKNDSEEVVLQRLCFKRDTLIRGGSKRLFKYFLEECRKRKYSEITSWSDSRWSLGQVYINLGFEKVKESNCDYFYHYRGVYKSKQSCTKSRLRKLGGVGDTEREMAASLGFTKVWDCGKITWKYQL